jgi:hypothetical protein
MNTEEIKATIRELEDRLNAYISTISIRSLEYAPFIVEVGALTVGTDESGVVIVENKNFPMQFSEDAVKKISSMTFRNSNDEIVQPKVYGKYDWYNEQIDHLKITLSELKKLVV